MEVPNSKMGKPGKSRLGQEVKSKNAKACKTELN